MFSASEDRGSCRLDALKQGSTAGNVAQEPGRSGFGGSFRLPGGVRWAHRERDESAIAELVRNLFSNRQG